MTVALGTLRVRRLASLADDECERYCVHCRRMTVWKQIAVVAERKIYRCQRCGCDQCGQKDRSA